MLSKINENEAKTGKRKSELKKNLLDLPWNVLLRIIEHVASYAERENCRLAVNRAMDTGESMALAKEISSIPMPPPNETLLRVPGSSRISYYVCYLQHERDPILDSAESLSLVNKYLYQLCAPILWKNLLFPTRFPISITLWTQYILPKHGHLVRHISFTLGKSFGTTDSSYPPEYENTLIYTANDRKEIVKQWVVHRYGNFLGLSPKTILKIFELCPNINSIKLKFPAVSVTNSNSQSSFIHEMSVQLNRIIPRCFQLTKLSILLQDGMPLPITLISSLLDQLPALSSLSCLGCPVDDQSRMMSDVERVQNGFALGKSISKLGHLTQLHFHATDFEFKTWTQFAWPATITQLTLLRCVGFYGSKFHELLQHIAPKLTTLTLQFGGDPYHPSDFCPNERLFTLPELTKLTLYADERYPLLIAAFRDCIALKQIIYHGLSTLDWLRLPELITRSSWPKLEGLELTSSDRFIESLRHHQNYLEDQVKVVCLPSNISLIIKDPPLKGFLA